MKSVIDRQYFIDVPITVTPYVWEARRGFHKKTYYRNFQIFMTTLLFAFVNTGHAISAVV